MMQHHLEIMTEKLWLLKNAVYGDHCMQTNKITLITQQCKGAYMKNMAQMNCMHFVTTQKSHFTYNTIKNITSELWSQQKKIIKFMMFWSSKPMTYIFFP